MDEQGYIDLRRHLSSVAPAFVGFCSRHEFEFANPLSLGRYPRIRIERVNQVCVWFDLWMSLDPDGHHFESFFDEIPYDLSAGVDVTFDAEPPHGRRYQVGFSVWDRRPFSSIDEDSLVSTMEQWLPQLSEWDVSRLRAEGTVVEFS
jgi:hypothetical protein